MKRLVPLLLISLFVLAGCASTTSLLEGDSQEFADTWSRESARGAEVDEQVVEEFGVYDDADLQSYVEDVGRKVLAESPIRSDSVGEILRQAEFTFRVLDDERVNAMALPGGYIYVTRGLLGYVNNEAQLAVVLGHEITHVLAQHGSSRVNKSRWTALGLTVASVAAEATAGVGREVADIGGAAGEVMLKSYSRENEKESDTHGARYAAAAGYDASEAADFFRTLERTSDNPPLILASHPYPGWRADWVEHLSRDLPGTTVGAAQYLQHIEGMPVSGGILEVVATERDGRIGDLLSDWISEEEIDHHAIINQVAGDEVLSAGRLVKVIRPQEPTSPQGPISSADRQESEQPTVEEVAQRPGDGGENVAWVQQTLNRLGYDCGTIDGAMGASTRSCIRAFQEANGVEATGAVNEATYEAMLAKVRPDLVPPATQSQSETQEQPESQLASQEQPDSLVQSDPQSQPDGPPAQDVEVQSIKTQIQSNTTGLFVRGYASGNRNFPVGGGTNMGRGLGAKLGFGFSPLLTAYLGLNNASMERDRGSGLAYLDVGAQLNFRAGRAALVPYLDAALSGTGDDTGASGIGVTAGGGLRYFVSPVLALDGGLFLNYSSVEVGGTEANVTGARLNLGISWFPFR